MWKIGLFNFTGTDSSSTVVGASLALVGTLLAAVITFIGTILKQSYDQQAEQRLKLEAAVRTLELFSTSEGKETPNIQRDGALFALSSLGQHELTLQLVNDLLGKKKLSSGTASSLLSNAILQGDDNVKEQAISVLNDHAARMLTKTGADIPKCLMDWGPGLPDYVREWAPIAICKIILARPVSKWSGRESRYEANAIIAALCLAWHSEKIPLLKNAIGAILQVLFKAFHTQGTLFHPHMPIDIAKIRGEIKKAKPEIDVYLEVVKRLNQWAPSERKAKNKE